MAARLGLSLRAYHRWCWAEDGTYHTARQRVKWVVDDLAAEQAARQRAQEPVTFGRHAGRIRWLGGGPCDPHDSAIFDDEAPQEAG